MTTLVPPADAAPAGAATATGPAPVVTAAPPGKPIRVEKSTLQVRQAGGAARSIPLDDGKYTIGSSPQCKICLPGPEVRPLQCLVTLDANLATVTRWAQGVLLNGQEFRSAPLAPGDRLSVGTWEVELSGAASAANIEIAPPSERTLTSESRSSSPRSAPAGLTPAAAAAYAFADKLVLELWRARDLARSRCRTLVSSVRAARSLAVAASAELEAARHDLAEAQDQCRAAAIREATSHAQRLAADQQLCSATDREASLRREVEELQAKVKSAPTPAPLASLERLRQAEARVAALETESARTIADLDAAHRELAEKSAQWEQLSAELAGALSRAEELSRQCEHERQACAEAQSQLADRDAELRRQSDELTAQNEQLGKRDAEAIERNVQLAERDSLLAERQSQITERDAEIARRAAELEARTEEWTGRDRTLAERQEEIHQRDRTIAEQREAIDRHDAELARQTAELAERLDEIRERDQQLADCQHQLSTLREELDGVRRELAESLSACTRLEEELQTRPIQRPVAEAVETPAPERSVAAEIPATQTIVLAPAPATERFPTPTLDPDAPPLVRQPGFLDQPEPGDKPVDARNEDQSDRLWSALPSDLALALPAVNVPADLLPPGDGLTPPADPAAWSWGAGAAPWRPEVDSASVDADSPTDPTTAPRPSDFARWGLSPVDVLAEDSTPGPAVRPWAPFDNWRDEIGRPELGADEPTTGDHWISPLPVESTDLAKTLLDAVEIASPSLEEAAELPAEIKAELELVAPAAEPEVPSATDAVESAAVAPEEASPPAQQEEENEAVIPADVDVDSQPAAAAAPVSFIDRYRHLLEEEGEPIRPTPARPLAAVLDDEFQSPSRSALAPHEDADDALDDYMSKMMARIRGQAGPGVASQAAPRGQESHAPTSVDDVQALAARSLDEAEFGHRNPPTDETPPEEHPLDPTPLARQPRKAHAPTDLAAMRVVANQMAVSAIARSRDKRHVEVAYTRVAICGAATIAAALLMSDAPEITDWRFWAGLACGLIGCWSATQLMRISRSRNADRRLFGEKPEEDAPPAPTAQAAAEPVADSEPTQS